MHWSSLLYIRKAEKISITDTVYENANSSDCLVIIILLWLFSAYQYQTTKKLSSKIFDILLRYYINNNKINNNFQDVYHK